MYRSPKFAFASLALVLAFGLAQAQTKTPAPAPAPLPSCTAPACNGPVISVEIHILRIGDELYADLAKENRFQGKCFIALDGKVAKDILEQIRDDDDSEAVASPKVATFSGQEARLFIGQQQPFVTELKVVKCAEQAVLVPQNQTLTSGCSLAIVPTIAPDCRHVLIRLQAEETELSEADVPVFPIATFVTPVYEGGAQGHPIPFTQLLQQPTLFKRSVTNTFGVADGQTAMIYGGHTCRTDRQVERVPFWSDLPFIGELFETTTEKDVNYHVVYMVTPRISSPSCADSACTGSCCPFAAQATTATAPKSCQGTNCPLTQPATPPCPASCQGASCPLTQVAAPLGLPTMPCPGPCCAGPTAVLPKPPAAPFAVVHAAQISVDGPGAIALTPVTSSPCQTDSIALTKLMNRYREACAAGHTEEAKWMAVACLEIDPTCFNRR